MTDEQRAKELLEFFWENDVDLPPWMLQRVLQMLRDQMSGRDILDFYDEQEMMYNYGWDDCLKQIDSICSELEAL
jgi:hypothetical protein